MADECSEYESRSELEWSIIIHKWKNHFFKMKGDIGMGWSSKKKVKGVVIATQ